MLHRYIRVFSVSTARSSNRRADSSLVVHHAAYQDLMNVFICKSHQVSQALPRSGTGLYTKSNSGSPELLVGKDLPEVDVSVRKWRETHWPFKQQRNQPVLTPQPTKQETHLPYILVSKQN
eukprot:1159749-Pelagomonas_calceolata.AAC.8